MISSKLSLQRAIALVAVLSLCLVASACSDASLTKTAAAIQDLQLGLTTIQTTVIDGNKAGAISDDQTATLLQLCVKLNQAGLQASAITRGLTKLAPADRGNLALILAPVLASVQGAIDSGLVGIKDAALQAKIRTVLLTVQTTLNVAEIALASGVKTT